MAYTTLATYIARYLTGVQRRSATKTTNAGTTAWLNSCWTSSGAPGAGATPGAAAVPSSTIAGAIGQSDGGSGSLRVLSTEMTITSGNGSGLILCDRLSHQGGLSGTAAGEQTTNLPTAALTRYTSGVGVFAALEIYTAIGTSGATVTVRYTNTTPTGSRTSQAFPFGVANHAVAGRFSIVPLQAGDKGVVSVEGVTLSGSSGTAGSFGVTLFRPLMMIPIVNIVSHTYDSLLNLGGQLPELLDGACLFFIASSASNGTPAFNGMLTLGEE